MIDKPKPLPCEDGLDLEKRSNIFSVCKGKSAPVLENSNLSLVSFILI